MDIPPTAAVASWYLSGVEGNRVSTYTDTAEQHEILVPERGEQLVLCPWQLESVRGQVDILWNYISFQEMEPPVVRFYLQQGKRLGARFVLLRNLREGKQRQTSQNPLGVLQPTTSEDYDDLLEGYVLRASNVHPFGFRTVDGFHSELRLYEKR